MKQKTIAAGVLVLALTAPTGQPGADAATSRILAGPDCGSTGMLSGTGPFTCTYSTVGSDTFTVPIGVTQAAVTVVGAQGGNFFIADGGTGLGSLTGTGGGSGGEAAGTLTGLTAGQVLQVDVAGVGASATATTRSGGMGGGITGGPTPPNPGGALGGFGGSSNGGTSTTGDAGGANGGTAWNGGNGSGGGGSSDVRVGPAGCAALSCALADRVLVGAGGGGDGGPGGSGGASGGAGGAGGGIPVQPVDQTTNPPNFGGAGGFVNGGNAGLSATGGTQTAGGTAGMNPGLHLTGAVPTDPRYGADGANGAPGVGGAGGAGNTFCTTSQNLTPPCTTQPNSGVNTSGGAAGGGGGGGYFGGGGGSGGGGLFGGNGGGGGGGGGGSSFAAATVSSPVLTSGINSPTNPVNGGNGQIVIAWMPVPATTTTLNVSPTSPAAFGTVETLTATVSPTAAGSVQFLDGAAPVGASVTVNLGSASTTTTLASGSHSLTAVFTPSDPTAFGGSTSAATTYTVTGVVNQTPTRTTLTASPPSPVAAGTLQTLTASVSPVTVPGTVQFLDGTTPVGDPVAVDAGAAETHTTLGSGTHSLTAVFTPTDSSAFAPSTSAATSYTVNPVPGQSSPTQPGSPSDAGQHHHGHGADHAPSGCPSGGCTDIVAGLRPAVLVDGGRAR